MAVTGPGFAPQEINMFVNVDDRGTTINTAKKVENFLSLLENSVQPPRGFDHAANV